MKRTWIDDWQSAAEWLLGCAVQLDADYARNIVVGGYLDEAYDKWGDAGLAEFCARPAMIREERGHSLMATALGTPEPGYMLPDWVRELILSAARGAELSAGTEGP